MSELRPRKVIEEPRAKSLAGDPAKAGKGTIPFLAAFVLLPAAFAHAFTVCKDDGCTYKSIKAALTDPATLGATIIVKPDIYYESNLTVTGGRTLQAENYDNPESTIIDANDAGPVFSGAGDVGGNVEIIGFTIRGGNTDAPGAGIRTMNHVALRKLIIEDNVSSYAGGGIGSNTGGGTVTIDRCTIQNNRAPIGGGVWMWGPDHAIITDCDIIGNEAFGNASGSASGGGVYSSSYNDLEIRNTEITGNECTGSKNYGAGIHTNGTARLFNVTVSSNSADDGSPSEGGGISVGGSCELKGGEISNNQANKGGGVYVSSAAVLTSSAVISGNTAREGTAGSGGGVYCDYPASVNISCGTVSGNTPDDITCLPPGEPPSGATGDSADNNDTSATDADPVNTFTGELFNQFVPDIDLGGPMPLFFARYYASGLLNANITGSLGNNWRHNFEWTLTYVGTDVYIVNHRGRLIQFSQNGPAWDLAGKTDIVYQLSEAGGTFTLLDPRSEQLYTFNPNGQLTSIADGKGNVHSLSYDPSGLLTQVTDGQGRTLSFAHDADDLLITVQDSTRAVTFGYTGDDLTSVVDPLGNLTTYTYAAGGLMTSTTRPVGNIPYTQTFHGSGKVASQTDADGDTFSFDYSGLETTLTDPLGNTRVHTHTATGEFSSREDQAGLTFTMGSDATGRRNSITDRLGDTTTVDYHAPSGNISTVTNADGTAYQYTYTARSVGALTLYDITGITHADGTTEGLGYDAQGNGHQPHRSDRQHRHGHLQCLWPALDRHQCGRCHHHQYLQRRRHGCNHDRPGRQYHHLWLRWPQAPGSGQLC